MNTNKPTLTACMLATITLAAPVSAQVELTDSAAISGFVNGVYEHVDSNAGSNEDLKLDQAEIDLIFNLDTVSGEIHLQSAEDGGTHSLELEQAFATIDFANGVSVSAGRFLSMLGFESDETVNRFTRSYAYDLNYPIPLYAEGINAKAVNEFGWVSVSVLDEVWDGYGTGNFSDGAIGVEIQGGVTTQQGLTAVIGYAGQDTGDVNPDPNSELLNIWVSYETGPFIFAAEYNDYNNAGERNNTGESYILLAHYSINNNLSITGRYAEQELENGDGSEKFTIAPKYSFTDNFAGRIEYSRSDITESGTEDEVDFFSVEAMFTF